MLNGRMYNSNTGSGKAMYLPTLGRRVGQGHLPPTLGEGWGGAPHVPLHPTLPHPTPPHPWLRITGWAIKIGRLYLLILRTKIFQCNVEIKKIENNLASPHAPSGLGGLPESIIDIRVIDMIEPCYCHDCQPCY